MKKLLRQFGLPSYLQGDSFAKDSKRISDKTRGKKRDQNSPEDIATEQDLLGRLRDAQEFVKGPQQPTNEFANGGDPTSYRGMHEGVRQYFGGGVPAGVNFFQDQYAQQFGAPTGGAPTNPTPASPDGGMSGGMMGGVTGIADAASGVLGGMAQSKQGYQNEGLAAASGALSGASKGAQLGMMAGPMGAAIGGGVGLIAGGVKSLLGAKDGNEKAKTKNRANSYNQAFGNSNFALGGDPDRAIATHGKNIQNRFDNGGDPTRPNTAIQNPDGSVELNGTTLLAEGQNALLQKKYQHSPDSPYLGKYGQTYAGADGFESKGANIMSYDQGQIHFNKKYNTDMQEQYMDKVRGLPENKGKDMYLYGSQNPKYMAPKGYQAGTTTQTAPVNQFADGGDPGKRLRDKAESAIGRDLTAAEVNAMNNRPGYGYNPAEPEAEPFVGPYEGLGEFPETSTQADQPGGVPTTQQVGIPSFEEALGIKTRPTSEMDWLDQGNAFSNKNNGVRKMATAISGPESRGHGMGEFSHTAPLTRLTDQQVAAAQAQEQGEAPEEGVSTWVEQLARTAPALANMYSLAKLGRPETNVSAKMTGKYKQNRVDEQSLQNIQRNINANTRSAILGASGGSGSAARANLLGAHRAGSAALSDAYMKADRINAAESEKAQRFDNRNAMVNLQQSNRDQDINAQNRGVHKSNKSKLIAQIGTDIGQMGKEALFRKYPFMAGMDYDSYGEYISGKKDSKKGKKK